MRRRRFKPWIVALHAQAMASHTRATALHAQTAALHTQTTALHVQTAALHVQAVALHTRIVALHTHALVSLATAPHTELKPLPAPGRVLQQISPGGWKIEAVPWDRGSEGGRLGKRR